MTELYYSGGQILTNLIWSIGQDCSILFYANYGFGWSRWCKLYCFFRYNFSSQGDVVIVYYIISKGNDVDWRVMVTPLTAKRVFKIMTTWRVPVCPLVYTPMHVSDKSYPTSLSFIIFFSIQNSCFFNNKLRVVIFYFIWLSLWNHAISNIDFFLF